MMEGFVLSKSHGERCGANPPVLLISVSLRCPPLARSSSSIYHTVIYHRTAVYEIERKCDRCKRD